MKADQPWEEKERVTELKNMEGNRKTKKGMWKRQRQDLIGKFQKKKFLGAESDYSKRKATERNVQQTRC